MINDCKMLASFPFKNSALFGVGPFGVGLRPFGVEPGPVGAGITGVFDTSGVFNQIKKYIVKHNNSVGTEEQFQLSRQSYENDDTWWFKGSWFMPIKLFEVG
jgi:hypothetical protein